MKPQELAVGEVYAGTEGKYDPALAVPMAVVDLKPWVMEFWVPDRVLRRPRKGESRNGELAEPQFPTAFKGLWVLVGTHEHYREGRFPTLVKEAQELLGEGPGTVPALDEGITSRVVLHYQLHMLWGDHLVQRAAAA